MKRYINNATLIFVFAAVIGVLGGGFAYGYLKIANVGITIIWDWIPGMLDTKFYTLGMCLVGGLVIGSFHKIWGRYPDSMSEAIGRVKNEGSYPYDKMHLILAGSLIPIFFGGAVGPEGGLVSILLAFVFWAYDQLRMATQRMQNIISKSPDTPRGKVLKQMLAGLKCRPKNMVFDASREMKTAELIFCGTAAGLIGLTTFILLSTFVGECISIPQLESSRVRLLDKVILMILIAAGIASGYLFAIFRKITNKFFDYTRTKDLHILNAVLGGAVLGVIGSVLPMSMFSGGSAMQALQYEYLQMTPILLLVIGVVKLFLTNVCIQSGWRGGHFFPLLFAGLSIGYGMSLLLDTNQVLCVCVVSASLLATVLQEPFAALILSLIFYPVEHIGWIAAASFAGGCIPMPKALRENPDNRGFLYNVTHFTGQKRLPTKERRR